MPVYNARSFFTPFLQNVSAEAIIGTELSHSCFDTEHPGHTLVNTFPTAWIRPCCCALNGALNSNDRNYVLSILKVAFPTPMIHGSTFPYITRPNGMQTEPDEYVHHSARKCLVHHCGTAPLCHKACFNVTYFSVAISVSKKEVAS